MRRRRRTQLRQGLSFIGVTSRWNHGAGLGIGVGTIVQDCHIVDNGQAGIEGYQANGAQVLNTEIAYNNYAGYNTNWDAGGLKVTSTSNLLLSGNNVHDNNGEGLWGDGANTNWTISGNTVTNNTGDGIIYEISDAGTAISKNVVANNGGAGIFISDSQGVSVSGNTITVSNTPNSGPAPGGGGIDIIDTERPDGRSAINNNVQGNVINYTGGAARQDGIFEFLCQPLPASANVWNNNTYNVTDPNGAYWHFGSTDYTWTSLRQNTPYESSGLLLLPCRKAVTNRGSIALRCAHGQNRASAPRFRPRGGIIVMRA